MRIKDTKKKPLNQSKMKTVFRILFSDSVYILLLLLLGAKLIHDEKYTLAYIASFSLLGVLIRKIIKESRHE